VVLALVSTAATIGLVAVAFRGGGSGEGGGSSPAPVVPAPTNGRLAFNCGDHICTVNPDGTGQIDLFAQYEPTDVVTGYYPRWSPDGTQLAFSGYDRRGSVSGGGANYDIFVVNADGSGLRNVTTSADDVAAGASQGMPVWSPDGSMIAFEGDDGRTDGLFVMNADGSGLSRVGSFGSPAWSPDGSRILVSGKGDDGSGLFSMAPDGSDVVQLTSGPGLVRDLSWSPDGSSVAFVRRGEDEDRVVVAKADGSGEAAVFIGAAEPYWPPAWSPDGTRLAFETGANGDSSVWVAQSDGSGAMDLTPGTTREEHTPAWSPDGHQIAFEGTEVTGVENTGTYRVYVIDADGSGERALTDDETSGFSLAWQFLPATNPEPTGTSGCSAANTSCEGVTYTSLGGRESS
jgi:Tol biopolymer transport system component